MRRATARPSHSIQSIDTDCDGGPGIPVYTARCDCGWHGMPYEDRERAWSDSVMHLQQEISMMHYGQEQTIEQYESILSGERRYAQIRGYLKRKFHDERPDPPRIDCSGITASFGGETVPISSFTISKKYTEADLEWLNEAFGGLHLSKQTVFDHLRFGE